MPKKCQIVLTSNGLKHYSNTCGCIVFPIPCLKPRLPDVTACKIIFATSHDKNSPRMCSHICHKSNLLLLVIFIISVIMTFAPCINTSVSNKRWKIKDHSSFQYFVF